MPNYRRNFLPGGTFFFTVVTYDRRPILTTEEGRQSLRNSIREIQRKRPFEMLACVLLPDHLHAIWTLPQGEADFAVRWRMIKEGFTRSYRAQGGFEGLVPESRSRRRERAVWQRRYWEHTCRNDEDLKRCIDYVHANPLKHGVVTSVKEYPWSTFHRFVREGEYEENWGVDVSFPAKIAAHWE
jgi:putative transposase